MCIYVYNFKLIIIYPLVDFQCYLLNRNICEYNNNESLVSGCDTWSLNFHTYNIWINDLDCNHAQPNKVIFCIIIKYKLKL